MYFPCCIWLIIKGALVIYRHGGVKVQRLTAELFVSLLLHYSFSLARARGRERGYVSPTACESSSYVSETPARAWNQGWRLSCMFKLPGTTVNSTEKERKEDVLRYFQPCNILQRYCSWKRLLTSLDPLTAHLSCTETCMALSDAVSDTTMTNNYGYNEKIY